MAAMQVQEIACQQVLLDDATVFSVQWTTLPPSCTGRITPDLLLQRYLDYIRRCTLTLIRPRTTPGGLRFSLLATPLSLISFLPPEPVHNGILLRICGGLLVQRRCTAGILQFRVEPAPDGLQVMLELSGFCPVILGGPRISPARRWLYTMTQARIHRVVTVGFLARMYRDLGGRLPVRIVAAHVRQGRPV